MSQLNYETDMTQAIEGMLVDNSTQKDTVSRVAAAALPCARLLVTDGSASLDGRGAKLPDADWSANLGAVEGVLMWDPSRVADPTTGDNFSAGVPLPVLRVGRIWVRPTNAVAKGEQAAAFYAGDFGKFCKTGTANAADVPGARYDAATAGADELCPLAINLPSIA